MVRYRQELFFGYYADPTQSQRSTSSPALLEAEMQRAGERGSRQPG